MDYAEFGKLVGVSKYTVSRWEKAGHVKATRFGIGTRIARIHRSEYDKLAGLQDEKTPLND